MQVKCQIGLLFLVFFLQFCLPCWALALSRLNRNVLINGLSHQYVFFSHYSTPYFFLSIMGQCALTLTLPCYCTIWHKARKWGRNEVECPFLPHPDPVWEIGPTPSCAESATLGQSPRLARTHRHKRVAPRVP